MYIPLSVPTRLPQDIQFDRESQWHTAALLSMAWESMTLPSRLRPPQGRRGLLGDMTSILNVNGNQRIASLQCTLGSKELHNGDAVSIQGSNDQRVPESNTRNLVGEDELHEANANLDVDLSGGENPDSAAIPTIDRAKKHTFARVENLRTSVRQQPDINGVEDEGLVRKRRRLAGVPIIEK